MLEGEWVILESGMEVCHGRMPRIARLGEEAEVGQAELPDQFRAGTHIRRGIRRADACMHGKNGSKNQTERRYADEYGRFAH